MHLDSGFFEELFRQSIGVGAGHVYSLDFGIDDEAGADAAGLIGAIKGSAASAGAVQAGLDDGILFGMHTSAEFMIAAGGNILLGAQTSRF